MAVYTKISTEEANEFLSNYHVGTLSSPIEIAEGVENSNYLLTAEGAKLILTLFEQRVAEEDLPFFLNLMDHLVVKGVPTAAPLKQNNGVLFSVLAQRPAALVEFLEGKARTTFKPLHCGAGGKVLAKLHHATNDFPLTRGNDLSIAGWRTLLNKCGADIGKYDASLLPFLTEELNWLEEHWPENDTLPRGIIHADFFPDNVFFTQDDITGVIDFYFACTDFYSYDLAITINAWCFDSDNTFLKDHAKAMVEGYNKVCPLTADEIEALPVLMRGASLRFLLTRLHDWLYQQEDALVTVKDPLEYIEKLRFHQQNNILDLI